MKWRNDKRMPSTRIYRFWIIIFVNLILQPIRICLVVEIKKNSNEYSLYPAALNTEDLNTTKIWIY